MADEERKRKLAQLIAKRSSETAKDSIEKHNQVKNKSSKSVEKVIEKPSEHYVNLGNSKAKGKQP